MKVFLDGRAINWTGIGTYIRNIVKRLPALDRRCRLTVVANGGEDDFPAGVDYSILKRPIPVYSLKEQLFLQSSFAGADLVHFPHFTVPLVFKKPYVVTLHDLIYYLFPGACPNRLGHWYARLMYPNAARKARMVIADSEFSKEEIVRNLAVPRERVRVIYPGVDTEHFRPRPAETLIKSLARYGISKPYILYVGNHQERKNIPGLVEAFARLRRRADYQLVIGGPTDPRRPEVGHMIKRLGLEESVVLTGWVPLEELPALYCGAACFVFPSLYEGFGLPALEAMACGTPVVSSDSSSLPEVVGEAGILIAPRDRKLLAESIEKVLESPGLREELGEKGVRRAKLFSWETTARETLGVYYEALGTSPAAS